MFHCHGNEIYRSSRLVTIGSFKRAHSYKVYFSGYLMYPLPELIFFFNLYLSAVIEFCSLL